MGPKFNQICAELSNRPIASKIERVQEFAYSDQSPAAGTDPMAIIHEIQKSGVKSLWTIADALNARGVRGARGGGSGMRRLCGSSLNGIRLIVQLSNPSREVMHHLENADKRG
jgi:hypothetical protein